MLFNQPTTAEPTLEPLPSLLQEAPQRLPTPNVPWWAQRKARSFIERIGAITEHDRELVRRLTQPIVERVQRKPGSPIRPEMLQDFVRDWTITLSGPSRLALVVDRHKKGLTLTEARITLSKNRFQSWPDGHQEVGLAMLLARVQLLPGVSKVSHEMLGGLCTHSLGRFWERAAAPSVEELFEEFKRIAIVHDQLTQRTGRFVCRTPHGAWIGDVDVMRSTGDRVLCVRSFLGPKELKMPDSVAAVVRFPITAAATATPAAGGEVRAALFRSYGANLPPQLDVSADVLSTFPGAVPALASWTSPIQPALAGYTHVSFGCVPSQNSRFELLKYLDTGGVLPAGTATANAAIATAFVLDHSSTTAFTGWAIRAVNSAGSAMTMANFTAVLSK